ncbi:MAG: DUF1330 domain-containing protein [Bacteroidia bacterium]
MRFIFIVLAVSLFLFGFGKTTMENEKSVYLIITANIKPENSRELQSYLADMAHVFDEHKGVPIGKYKTTKHIIGNKPQELTAIIEFPNSSSINKMLKSSEYLALSHKRKIIFDELNIATCLKIE